MQANSWHINYSSSICPFESGKHGKEGKKLQNFEYLKNKESFLDEIKNIFQSFQRALGEKNKKMIKHSGDKALSFLLHLL